MAVEYLENKIQNQAGIPLACSAQTQGASTRAWHFLPFRDVFSRFHLR